MSLRNFYQILLFAIFSLVSFVTNAQRYNFDVISVKDGLYSNQINDFYEDKKGYMWVATMGGVARFDGVNLVEYGKDKGLFDNKIRCIQGFQDDVYAGCENGLFSIQNDTIIGIDLTNHPFKSVFCLEQINSQLIIGTNKGLYKKTDQGLDEININSNISKSKIISIIQASENACYLLLEGGEIIFLNINQDIVSYKSISSKNDFPKASAIAVDKDGNLWIGTFGTEIYKYDQKGALDLIITPDDKSISMVNNIEVDQNGNIWFSSWGNGVLKYNGFVFEKIEASNGLIGNNAITIFCDSENHLWFGTLDNGIVYSKGQNFIVYGEQDKPSGNFRNLTASTDGTVWAATLDGIAFKKSGMDHFEYLIDLNGNNRFGSIIQINDAEMLATTYSAEIYKISILDLSLTKISQTVIRSEILSLTTDGENCYLGTLRNGIFQLDNKDNLKQIVVPADIKNKEVWSLLFAENLFIGTDYGVYKRTKDGYCKQLGHKKKLHGTKVTSIINDPQNTYVFFGTFSSGIVKYHVKNDQIEYLDTKENLSSNLIYSMAWIEDSTLLATSNLGLDVIKFTKDEHFIKNYSNFTEKGLNFNTNAICQIDGMAWVGANNGLLAYNYTKQSSYSNPPHFNFTEVKVSSKQDWIKLDNHANWQDSNAVFNLESFQNAITIKFHGIKFSNQQNIKYQYYLKGLEDSWSPLSSVSSAMYNNLFPNEYEFMARCSADGGITFSKVESFTFNIANPFYKTPLFFVLILCILTFISSIYYGAFGIIEKKRTLKDIASSTNDATNRWIILFIGIAYPCATIFNDYIDSSIRYPQSDVASYIGSISFILLLLSFKFESIKINLNYSIKFLYSVICIHVLFLLFLNQLHPGLIIGMVLVLTFSSVVFDSFKQFIIFSIIFFLGALLVTYSINEVETLYGRLQFLSVLFWILSIILTLLLIKTRLVKNLQFSDKILSQTDSLVLVKNSDNQIVYVSQSFNTQLGISLDHVYSNGISTVNLENSDSEKLTSTQYTNKVLDNSGNEFIIRWSTSTTDDGYYIAVGHDISEDRKRQIEFEKISIIASKTDNMVVLLDNDNNIEWANDAMVLNLGYSQEELIGQKPAELFAGKDSDLDQINKTREDKAKNENYKIEALFYKKSGEPVWLSITHTPIYDEQTNELLWQVEIITDVTKEIQQQKELTQLSMVAKKTDNYVLITDKNDNVQWTNEGFTTIFGFEKEEVLNIKVSDFLSTEDLNPRVIKQLRKRVFEDKLPFIGEFTDMNSKGDHIWLSVNITPVLDKNNEIDQIISIGSDITDRKLNDYLVNQQSKSIALLHTIDNILLDELDDERTFFAILKKLIEHSPMFQRTSMILFDEESDLAHEYYCHKNLLQKTQTHDRINDFSGIEVLKSGEIFIADDLENLEYLSDSDLDLLSNGIKSYIMLPLFFNGKIQGTLNIGGSYPFMFTEEDINLYKDIANVLAIAYKQRIQSESIKQSEINFRQLTESIAEAFWLFDVAKGKIVYVSSAYENIYGAPPQQLIDDPTSWDQQIIEEDLERVRKEYNVITEGKPFDSVYRIMHPIKGIRWISAKAFRVLDENGKLVKISGLTKDITESKEIENKLNYLNNTLFSIQRLNESIIKNEEFGDVLLDSIKLLMKGEEDVKRITVSLFDPVKNEVSFFTIDPELRKTLGETTTKSLKFFKNYNRLLKKEIITIENLSKVLEPSESDELLLKLGIDSYIMVPLIADKEVFGSLNISFEKTPEFNDLLIAGLKKMAAGISVSIFQRRLRNQIDEDKIKLETVNKDITDSIVYAKRIQDAHLSEDKFLERIFSNTGLYYKPKDIVSGDFYWWTVIEGKLVVIVGDCTGHGVPGGFMTILGIQSFHSIVNEKKITDPVLILKMVNIDISHALSKGDDTVNDGMDVCCLVYDLQSKKAEYSGARRPLIYFSENELIEIKGTKRSIGETESAHINFTSTEIQFKKGDRIFMFSDGLPDQFGQISTDKRKRKYSSRKIKSVLTDNVNKKFDTQFDLFVTSFDEWKKDTPQTDDIVLLAIEI